MKTTSTTTTAYTFAILHNGREVENIQPGTFFQHTYAELAAQDMLDDLCPAGSPHRSAYRIEVRRV